jgi:hypothetical protein
MSGEVRYYKDKHRVKVVSESKGNWIVEALESFEDDVHGQEMKVKIGERRIVAPNLLFIREGLPPPVKEHVYELHACIWLNVQTAKKKTPNPPKHGNTDNSQSKPTHATTAKHNTENTTTKTENTASH